MDLRKLPQYLRHPQNMIGWLCRKGYLPWVSDEAAVKYIYWWRMGSKLNLRHPQTFNEKLQWLKLHDRDPAYHEMVDKYSAKKWAAARIGEEHIIPALGVWEHFDDIDFDALPEQFVLKCTHDSGSVVIVKSKSAMDKSAAREKLEKALSRDWSSVAREWAYKDIQPRILAEQYMVDESGKELKDYKVFCFDGEPRMIEVDYGRFTGHKRNLYTTDWRYIEAAINYPTDPAHIIPRPEKLDELLALAKKLSAGIPHVRTDFYVIGDRIYFGEMTFYHGAGHEKMTPRSLDFEMGSWLRLPAGDKTAERR